MKQPWVSPPDDTGAFTRALLASPAGTNVLGVSQFLSNADFVKTWSRVTGLRAQYKQITMDQFKESLPGPVALEVSESVTWMRDFGWCGDDKSVKNPDEIGLKQEDLTIAEEYFRSVDWKAAGFE